MKGQTNKGVFMAGTDLNEFLEPNQLYQQELKTTRFTKSEEKFNALLAQSQVDSSANKVTVEAYQAKMVEVAKATKALNGVKAKRGWAIFGIVMGFVLLVVFGILTVSFAMKKNWFAALFAGLAVLSLVMAIWLIHIVKSSLNGAVAEKSAIKAKLEAEAETIRQQALVQVAPLKNLLTYQSQLDVLNTLVGAIHFEDHMSEDAFAYMDEKYGLSGANDSENSSVVGLVAGSISKNPFVLLTQKNRVMGTKTYTNSITITWETTHRDSDGNLVTEHHSQTLSAEVTAPCPYYNLSTYLIYGNDAAPDLSFSRSPSGLTTDWTPGGLAHKIKERNHDLQKQAEKAIKQGKTYTALGDDDFEALFGGEDRDNEVQYRLLFTPLAQRSLISLIEAREPYGDDFYFQKKKKLNFISAAHQGYGQNVVQAGDMAPMIDVEELKKYYVNNTALLFTSLYFTFAPLLAIPLYTQYAGDFKEKAEKDLPTHVAPFEWERMLNKMDDKEFVHPDSATDCILKGYLAKKMDHCDVLNVVAHTFSATDKTSYFTKMGGDGYSHTIPVDWVQYDPLERQVNVTMSKTPSLQQFEANLKNAGLSDSYFRYGQQLLALKPKHQVNFQDLDAFFAKIIPPDMK
jgi:hypothetical protein